MAVMICKAHSVHTIGDHHVWYGEVMHAYTNGEIVDPLLYYARYFHVSLSDFQTLRVRTVLVVVVFVKVFSFDW